MCHFYFLSLKEIFPIILINLEASGKQIKYITNVNQMMFVHSNITAKVKFTGSKDTQS